MSYPNLRRSTRNYVPNYSQLFGDSDDDDSPSGMYMDDDDDDGTYNFPGSTSRLIGNRYQQYQPHYQHQVHDTPAKKGRSDWVQDNKALSVQRWGRQLCQVGNYNVEKWEKRVLDDGWKQPNTTPQIAEAAETANVEEEGNQSQQKQQQQQENVGKEAERKA